MPYLQKNHSQHYKSFYAVYYWDNIDFTPHFHPNFEFIHVLEGTLTVYYEDTHFVLQAGDNAFILPNHIHGFNKNNYSKCCICSFSTDHVPSFSNAIRNKTADDILFDLDKSTLDFVMNQLARTDVLSLYEIKSLAYAICANFYNHVKLKEKASSDILHKMLEYLTENCSENISLNDVALHLGYEPHYLSRKFHEAFEMGFSTYINQLRISNSKSLLASTDHSITSIATQCGFSSIRTFNRAFQQNCNMTPKQYRLAQQSRSDAHND